MGSLKEFSESRSDFNRLSVDLLAIHEGWNVRDITTDRYKEHIEGLATSIDKIGVTDPIKGVWDSNENKFYITNGHCRYAALQLLKERHGVTEEIRTVPIIPESSTTRLSPEARMLTMLTSNSGLALTPLEKAEVFRRLRDKGWVYSRNCR